MLGAGASIPAGLSDINELTQTYESKLTDDLEEPYYFVKQTLEKKWQKVDLEHILTQLNEFVIGTRETSTLFYEQKKREVDVYRNIFPIIKVRIQKHFREQLEIEYTVDYLLGLKGFIEQAFRSKTAIDVFTLNYDSVIETFCEKEGIEYTDGFRLKWDPQNFNHCEWGIRLYKLHGSLYWFRTESNKLVKIPIKKYNIDKAVYYSDEKLTEAMIYPTVNKELEATPYLYLRNMLKFKLLSASLLIIVGYSFRDQNILDIVKEQLRANTNLWILIIDLNPNSVKKRIISSYPEVDDRIITLKMDVEKAIGNRVINEMVQDINNVRVQERSFYSGISRLQSYNEGEMQNILYNYIELNLVSRVKSLSEYVFSRGYTNYKGPSFQVRQKLFSHAVNYGLQCCIDRNWINAELWFQIFGSIAASLEFELFRNYNREKFYADLWEVKSIPFAPGWSNNFDYVRNALEAVHIGIKKFNLKDDIIIENVKGIEKTIKHIIPISKSGISVEDKRFRQFIKLYDGKDIGIYLFVSNILSYISKKIGKKDSLTANWEHTI